ncbi:transglutaminase TgpA family protein [Arthrobacter sp. YAF16]|uniref:transglutaminase TgpA family protein n=1 Tax=Arthrobacter sp. YAF16 TaxID=3233076 RepID=UPI003F930D00
MTLTPQRNRVPGPSAAEPGRPSVPVPGAAAGPKGAGVEPWAMGLAVAVAVAGAALGLNGVLRGWAWYPAVLTTVFTVALAMAGLRALRLHGVLVGAGGFVVLALVLTFTFFRQHSIAGFIPSGDTMAQLQRYLRRASETVLAESSPVAPNAGIVLLICGVLGLVVVLVDALAVPLALPATSGLGILAILVVPAMVKPQSVGWLGFTGAAAGYLMILASSHWFHPNSRTRADTARNPGQLKRASLTGAVALVLTLLFQLAIPGFDQGIFPQGSRLNPWGSASGLNPMISLGNSLRSPTGDGRITYATNASQAPYLRSVTVDSFDGDAWAPDDRDASRQPGTGRMDPGPAPSVEEQVRVVTAVNTGQFTSPYLPAPYAPESVNGLTGRWSWDPATLSIKGLDTNSRNQQYVVASVAPKLTRAVLADSPDRAQAVPDTFTRVPANVPQIVRQTADTVTAGSRGNYAKAMAIQQYLRSAEFSYSLQSPVQGGYDGNGLSVLADFLAQKSGYCIHFSSAMAVMARLEGIPSRVAVGYAPGRATGSTVTIPGLGALPEYEVDARDAHAWPELYFQGVGWVAFEPTPSRGVVPGYATEPAARSGASTNENNDGLIPEDDLKPTAAPAPAPLPLPATAGGDGSGSSLVPLLYGSGGLLLVLLLLSAPALARGGVRRRRLKASGLSGAAAPAWAELRDLATDFGIPPRSSETPRHFSARLRGSAALGEPGGVDAPAHAAVASLSADFERQRYGRPGPDSPAGNSRPDSRPDSLPGSLPDSPADRVEQVRDALRAHASWWTRWRAIWLPPSLTAGWRRRAWTPLRAVSVPARAAGRGAAESWSRVRDAARRLRRS